MASSRQASWQRERNAQRQPYLRRLEIGAAVPCQACEHVRSSHSMNILTGRCRVPDCGCQYYEPACGCRHLLHVHQWGSAEAPWACSRCPCKKFGPIDRMLTLEELRDL